MSLGIHLARALSTKMYVKRTLHRRNAENQFRNGNPRHVYQHNRGKGAEEITVEPRLKSDKMSLFHIRPTICMQISFPCVKEIGQFRQLCLLYRSDNSNPRHVPCSGFKKAAVSGLVLRLTRYLGPSRDGYTKSTGVGHKRSQFNSRNYSTTVSQSCSLTRYKSPQNMRQKHAEDPSPCKSVNQFCPTTCQQKSP